VTVDPHLEEVVRYSAAAKRAAAIRLAPSLGGFVAALVLLPNRWLVMTAFYGGACLLGSIDGLFRWRKLRKQITAAPPMPPGAVEVERQDTRVRELRAIVLQIAVLLGTGWFWGLLEHSFAWGLFLAAVTLGFGAVRIGVVRWSLARWERRNGRILTSLLLGEGEVFYVERGLRTA
jgi:hypothetical protein